MTEVSNVKKEGAIFKPAPYSKGPDNGNMDDLREGAERHAPED